ncbi:MAG: EcoAI/FtnUII family type I restriction enzme subunit R [Neptuniibacter sp.]
MDKKQLSEADIISKFILPAILNAGWDDILQIRQEVKLRDGKVIVRGNIGMRTAVKSADIVLYHKPNIPLAVVEAKANKHEIGKGMQQGLDYARLLDVPFIFASNGDGFIFHDKTAPANGGQLETEISLDEFPSPQALHAKLNAFKSYTPDQLTYLEQDYYDDGTDKAPRYYQLQAVNKTIEAISQGEKRILLVMATGVGKTYTAFQIAWRLWKAKKAKRILFLADRNVLIDDPKRKDFQPFGEAMTKITGRKVDPAYEVHLGIYQALTGPEEHQKAFKGVSKDFFDLIVIDECHRGSADEDSAWREILEYFDSATQIGLTATPKETNEVSNIDYFGEAVYTYSLKEGIEDGFLSPYKVIRVDIDIDAQGFRPEKGQLDKNGNLIKDRIYNQKDFDRTLIIDERTQLVAETITAYLKRTDPMAKTIVFCNDINHAERMRRALVNLNPEQIAINEKYVMKITGDDELGKNQLENFMNPKKPYPVIATTSELMTTGVDAKTCKLIVLDQNIQSMTKFKQIIGRGTRIDDKLNKLWFTILDFKKATELFADERFDGIPEQIMEKTTDDIISGEGNINDETVADGGESSEEFEGLGTQDGIGEVPGEYDSGTNGNEQAWPDGPINDDDEKEAFIKYHISGVTVKKLAERVQYYDSDGKLVTESFKDYTRKTVKQQFSSLDDFITKWHATERKQAIIDELAAAGVIWEALEEDVSRDLDPFDLICHVAFDQPPLTRKERANNVKKRNYFGKYSETAQQVLNSLLEKYENSGVTEIESKQVLKVTPFDKIGRPLEIKKNAFGGKEQYEQAISELEDALYQSSDEFEPQSA